MKRTKHDCHRQESAILFDNPKQSHNFSRDKRAGEVEEEIAQAWLQGLDFGRLTPITYACNRQGYFTRYSFLDNQVWERQTADNNNGNENNENRDYIVRYPGGQREETHEIKGQYRAYGDVPGAGAHTTKIYIEVDVGAIANIESFEKQIQTDRAWFHPGTGSDENGNPYHADWYHHVLPLYKRDGEVIDDRSRTCTRKLTDGEIEQYLDMVQPGECIITEMPGGIILTLSGQKTREILEKYARIEFDVHGKRTGQKLPITINVKDVIDSEIMNDTYDGQAAITPICEFIMKGGTPNRNIYEMPFYMPSVLFDSISEFVKYEGKEQLLELRRVAGDDLSRGLCGLAATQDGSVTIWGADKGSMYAYSNYSAGRIDMPINPMAFYYYLPRLPMQGQQ